MLLTVILFTVGCSKDEEPVISAVADPEGTISMGMRTTGSSKLRIEEFPGSVSLVDNNFVCEECEIISLGELSGLGNIIQIPEKKWSESVFVSYGRGYIARFTNESSVAYVRIFVEGSSLTTSFTVKYQYPFNGEVTEIQYTQEDTLVTVNSLLSWSVASDAAWCPVEIVSATQFRIKPDLTLVPEQREANITLRSEGLNDAVFTYSLAPTVKLSSDTLFFTNRTESKPVLISGKAAWTATGNAAWLSVSPASGTGGNNALNVTVTANAADEPRTGTVTIKATDNYGTTEKTLTIVQDAPDFAGGTGTTADPYQIKTARHLNNLHKYAGILWKGKAFKLMNDVDLYDLLKNTTNGWIPVPDFYGTLDGGGYAIKNIWVKSEGVAGVFTAINDTVRNLGIEIQIGKNITGGDITGGLAGRNNSGIINCYVKGNVSGKNRVGGLVGVNNGTIQQSYAEVDVTAISEDVLYAGGLIGRSEQNKTIQESYSKGTVSASSTAGEVNVGGLVGRLAYSNVLNCYSLSNVKADSPQRYYVGGFVGAAWTNATNLISNCYAAGYVSGGISTIVRAGGFVGEMSGNGNSLYFDLESSERDSDGSGGKATAKTTAEMKLQTTFTGWDFNTVWSIEEGISYPSLR